MRHHIRILGPLCLIIAIALPGPGWLLGARIPAQNSQPSPASVKASTSTSSLTKLLTLEPIAAGLSSALDLIRNRLRQQSQEPTGLGDNIQTLYARLLDLQQARGVFIESLNSYIHEVEKQPNERRATRLAIATHSLEHAITETLSCYDLLHDALEKIQVQLDLGSPEFRRGIDKVRYGQSGYLIGLKKALNGFGLEDLRDIASKAAKNSKLLEDAIDQLRTFVRQKFPSIGQHS